MNTFSGLFRAKATFLALLISFFVVGGVFATETKPVVKASSGVVVSFTSADTTKATPASLVVKVGTKDETFVVDAKTVVEGKDKKVVDLATVKAGAKVEVKYTSDAKKVLTVVSVTLK